METKEEPFCPLSLEEIDDLYKRHLKRGANTSFTSKSKPDPDNLAVDEISGDYATTTDEADEERDLYPLFQYRTFRYAADYVARAFSAVPEVSKVVLLGSVAKPPMRESIRTRQRGWIETWHSPKDLDLAVWMDHVENLRSLQRARVEGLKLLSVAKEITPAHHQIDVFLFESGESNYLGRLCWFSSCPKESKRECLVTGCGEYKFLRQHEEFVFNHEALLPEKCTVLFKRGS